MIKQSGKLTIFHACKQITALEAAQKLCFPLKQSGKRYWTCCPLHGESTPSMMFDEHGCWYCFGCNTGGDAVSLYAAYFKERPIVAARRMAQDFQINLLSQPEKPKAAGYYIQGQKSDNGEEQVLCLIKHAANVICSYSDGEIFWEALKLEAEANEALLNIDARLEFTRFCSLHSKYD